MRDYGGLLALFKLSKFIRIELLEDTDKGIKRNISKQKKNIHKQGNLVLRAVGKIPRGAKKITGKNIAIPDGEGGYHYLTSKK